MACRAALYDDQLIVRSDTGRNEPTRVHEVVSPRAYRTRFYSDALDRVVLKRATADLDAEAASRDYDWRQYWDELDRVTAMVDPEGTVTRRRYWISALPESVDRFPETALAGAAADGAPPSDCEVRGSNCLRDEYGYNLAGEVTRHTDPRGYSTQYTYELGCPATKTAPEGQAWTYLCDAGGNVVAATNAGSVTKATYDWRNRLRHTDLPSGLSRTLVYDMYGKLRSVVESDPGSQTRPPQSATWTLEYDALGNVIRAVDPDGFETTSRYTETNDLDWTADSRGPISKLTFQWTRSPTATTEVVTDADGGTRTILLDLEGRPTDVSTKNLGATESFFYNAYGLQRSRVRKPTDDTWLYSYDSAGRPTVAVSPEQRATRYRYDFGGRLVGTSQEEAGVTAAVWVYGRDGTGNITGITNPAGGYTEQSFDGLGRLKSRKVQTLGLESYAYAPDNRSVTFTDRSGNTWRTDLDLAGRATHEADPESFNLDYDRDAWGRVLFEYRSNDSAACAGGGGSTSTAARAVRTMAPIVEPTPDPCPFVGNPSYSRSWTFYPSGRLHTAQEGTLPSEHYEYRGSGQLHSIKKPSGRTRTLSYERALPLPSRIVVEDGRVFDYAYDDLGRVVTETEAPGTTNERTTTWAHNDAQRSTTETRYGTLLAGAGLPGPFTFVRSPDGLPASESGPDGAAYTYHHDALGRLVWTQDPNLSELSYGYDPLGSFQGTYDTSGTIGEWTTYDALGRPDQETLDGVVTRTFSYHPATGELNGETRAGEASRAYTYRKNGWLETISAIGTSARTFAYDGGGFVGGISSTTFSPVRTTSLEYVRDSAGRIIAEKGSSGEVHEADYDADGLLTRIDGVRYDRDPLTGRISDVRVGPTTGRLASFLTGMPARRIDFEYDAYGNVSRRYTAAGFSQTFGFYDTGNLHTVTDGAATYTLGYDDTSRLNSVESGGAVVTGTSFDRGGRLEHSTSASKDTTYHYSPTGNLSSLDVISVLTGRPTTETRFYDRANQMYAVTAADSASLSHSARGHLDSVSYASGRTTTYGRDGWGRLQSVQEGGVTRTLSYDLADRLVGVTGPCAATVRYFASMPVQYSTCNTSAALVPDPDTGRPMAQLRTTGLELDTRIGGVTRHMASENGAELRRFEREPYGAIESGDPSYMPFGFKGYFQIPGTSLHFTGARLYDDSLRYFVSPDPLVGNPSRPLSMNRHRAFSADPVNMTDVLGLADAPDPSGSGSIGVTLPGPDGDDSGVKIDVSGLVNLVFGLLGGGGSNRPDRPTVDPSTTPPLPGPNLTPPPPPGTAGHGLPTTGPSAEPTPTGGTPTGTLGGRFGGVPTPGGMPQPARDVADTGERLSALKAWSAALKVLESPDSIRVLLGSSGMNGARSAYDPNAPDANVTTIQKPSLWPLMRMGYTSGQISDLYGRIDQVNSSLTSRYATAKLATMGMTMAMDSAAMAGSTVGRTVAGRAVCFAPGTSVATPDGAVDIEDLQPGSEVFTYDVDSGETRVGHVRRLVERDASELRQIVLDLDDLVATPEHPFWVEGEGWTAAGLLRPGDLLRSVDGSAVSVRWIAPVADGSAVYNLEIEGDHAYFVSNAAVLVHNDCAAPVARGAGVAAGGAQKLLPAARQIEAAWSASTYRHGGRVHGRTRAGADNRNQHRW